MEPERESGITFTGYADQTGSFSHNKKLSLERVNFVYNLLKKMGIDKGIVTKNTPVSSMKLVSGGKQGNRRVEMSVKYDDEGNRVTKILPDTIKKLNNDSKKAVSPKIKTKLLTVHFDSSSYELKKNDAVYLNQYSDLFEKAVLIDIAGYTDHTGSMELNKKLSFQRTNAIYNYLKEKMNVNENVLIKRGGGSFGKPLNGGKEVNRRVEIEIYVKKETNYSGRYD